MRCTAALDRLSREIAAVQRITETEAVKEIDAAAKGAALRRRILFSSSPIPHQLRDQGWPTERMLPSGS